MKKTLKPSLQIRNEAGITMLEVLVGIVIMTLGIFGLLSSVNTVNHYQRHSKDMTLATMHASNKLEEIKRIGTNEPTGGAFGFNHLVDDTTGGFLNGYSAPDNFTRSSSDTIEGMTRNWTISIYPASAQATQSFLVPGAIRMIEALVTTTWTDEKGASKSVEVAAVLHRRQFVGAN